ncbi:Uncharacterized conserved protein, DUF2141 family [Hymenobacter daecheongensis DSM 21074]|uniref:Uncharacterized conserved protein, DUF2141 family n=1 Tax=Hymenobacter daecheongensis DSM 21074 TaxID=1121955 RepID=A0A1M6LAD9_9BACT|nr:DUF2141 domain-containing protein [Hymenobacter daecheongensis]SHJ68122.1 Uncharacterized conserved protein, DUF2141 family [Hymenobacter daecheongensis DSM 21074]
MKRVSLVLLATASTLLGSAGLPARADNGGLSSVTVVVSQLVSTKSAVKVYFYNVRDKFLQHGGYAFMRVVKPGGQNQIQLPIDLPDGEWAVAITQDINNNDKLDKNFLGIPTEPYAFSNNIRPTVSAPDFNQCKFMVKGSGKVVSIVLKK